jgi:adenylosuccinate synthase
LRAYIVVDLGFGDSGKGLLTDYLVRHFNAGVVVRYNGGAQAGHNVVTPGGQHHTFSQFGAGTFIPHTRTYLSRHVVIHPTALLVEGDLLQKKGVQDPFSRLRISEQALVITPFHQATNRIREIVRGANRHGSCGVGVGETVEDALINSHNCCIVAGHLNNPTVLQRKLNGIREQKWEQVIALCKNVPHSVQLEQELKVFQKQDVINVWMSSVSRVRELGLVVSDFILKQWLTDTEHVVFEGAQGVLLDEDVGFHPYTTWSHCTTVNAQEIVRDMAPGSPVFQIGVMRSYMMRHGPGPLPSETNELASMISEHNTLNKWQGAVRYGWFDAVLARYALQATGGVDSLAVTHMDILPHLDKWKYCQSYKEYQNISNMGIDTLTSNGLLTNFRTPDGLSLDQRAQFTQALFTVTPELNTFKAKEEDVIQGIETLIGRPVGIVSHGPSAEHVQALTSLL